MNNPYISQFVKDNEALINEITITFHALNKLREGVDVEDLFITEVTPIKEAYKLIHKYGKHEVVTLHHRFLGEVTAKLIYSEVFMSNANFIGFDCEKPKLYKIDGFYKVAKTGRVKSHKYNIQYLDIPVEIKKSLGCCDEYSFREKAIPKKNLINDLYQKLNSLILNLQDEINNVPPHSIDYTYQNGHSVKLEFDKSRIQHRAVQFYKKLYINAFFAYTKKGKPYLESSFLKLGAPY